jgi:serine/threonine protein kinase
MDERWQRITDIFNAVLEREPGKRERFLDDACERDAALRAEVESLLAAHGRAAGFLEEPAALAGGWVARADGISPGDMLGAYRVTGELGRGGMGVVYQAEDTRLGRQVAVKVLTASVGADAAMRERLRREARAAAALSHPAIATVFSFEDIDGRACLVTEFVRGDTLRTEIARGPLPIEAVIDTGIQVARGLAAAHAAGVVHRDLKPENVVRNREGGVKILDFGIARLDSSPEPGAPRLTHPGSILGTPGYMSPEQLDGSDVDGRADIFALGVLLFELATARHPFEAATPGATAARVMAADPHALSALDAPLAPGLDAIVRRCLRRHRADRYASALEVARDLQDLRDGRLRSSSRGTRLAERTANPVWWWRIHQVSRMAVEGALAYGMWRVYTSVRHDWTLSLFLAYVVTGAINGTLRTHLLFTSSFNTRHVDDQVRSGMPLVRGTDLVISVLLLLGAATVARSQALLPAILAAFAVGWGVTSLTAEPAITKAAFPHSS